MRHASLLATCLLTLLLALPGLARAQSLAHEKYTLDNGLTVILHQDRTLPSVTINLWYKVGARNEPPGRSGFAHLFEHLMFMGTRRVPGNAFDVLMENGGGSNNASTSLDRTNYFSIGPSELLPTLLWLDADRLEDMGKTMTQDKLDLQRDVVRNERRQTIENQPYAKAYEASYQLMYPPSHPYHNGVMGTHADLEAAQVQDVQDFFATFYTPANCSLVVAGDFDIEPTKALIATLFSSIPRGNTPAPAIVEPIKLTRVLRATSLDKVELPKIAMSFHSPGAYKQGEAEAELLAMVLADGPGSRLYDRLVTGEELAVDVSAFQDSAALGSIFRVEVTARPDADLTKVERVIDEELARLAKEGPTDEELARRRAIVELSKITPLQSLQARADRMNEYEHYFGTPDALKQDLARYRNALPNRVQRVAASILTLDVRLIQTILPESASEPTTPREQRPEPFAAKPFVPQAPEQLSVSGVPVLLWSRPASAGGLPLVSASLLFVHPVADPLEPANQSGAATLAMDMLTEGTGDLDGPAFAAALQQLGASMSAGASTESVSISLSGLSRTFAQSAALWTSALRAPRLEASDFERIKSIHLQNLAQAEQNPGIVARRVAMRALLGDANPYSRLSLGTPETIAPLSRDTIAATHAKALKGRAVLMVAGDITADQVREIFTPALQGLSPLDLGAAATSSTTMTATPTPAASTDLRVLIVDRPDAPQTMVMFASPGVAMNDASRVARQHLSTILGGSFTSRLNQNLREKNGFTYGARSSFTMAPSLGWFTATAAVQSKVTGPALTEFLSEFARIKSGDISADEAQKAARSIRQDVVGDFESLDGILTQAASRVASNLPFTTIADDLAAASTITESTLNTLANSAINTNTGVLVLVGDKATILQQLAEVKALPTPTQVDPYGNEIK